MDEINTTFFAPEIERALVSLAWHFPADVLARVLRHLNPEIHFHEPFCAQLLDAINLVYSDLNTTDWPTVVDCFRQQNSLTNPETLAALSAIFSLAEYQNRKATRDLVDYYIELLKDYALLRGPLPPSFRPPVLHFSGGSALLKDNAPSKRYPSQPDFLGPGRVKGNPYEVSLWIDKDAFKKTVLKLRFKPLHNGL
jgi:hypothetical protein